MRQKQSPQISVLVPVYKNSDTLPELYQRLCQVLESHRFSFVILFIDDACPEGSDHVLKELVEKDPRVNALLLDRNIGQHRAVFTGLSFVRGEWTIVLDADLQDPPEAISYLIAKAHEGFHAVFAGRKGAYESSWRLVTSKTFKWILHFLCGLPVDAGLYVALSQTMVQKVVAMRWLFPYVPAMIACSRLPILSVPLERAPRLSGRSAYSMWRRFQVGFLAILSTILWKTRIFSRNPDRKGLEVRVKAYLGSLFET